MNLLLDTGILGQLCHPSKKSNQSITEWIQNILTSGSKDRIFVPELCDYELRRKLLHLVGKGQSSPLSIQRLDELDEILDYLPLDSATFRKAAEFWSESRLRGNPTAADIALDGDVILAAQAAMVSGTIVTTNRKHLAQFVPAYEWSEIFWAYAFICISGPVDNLAFDWPNHFVIHDSRGRDWHCRQDATWNSQKELENNQILDRVQTDLVGVKSMYEKLFRSGNGTEDETIIQAQIIMYPVPVSQLKLHESLKKSLSGDEDSDPEISIQL